MNSRNEELLIDAIKGNPSLKALGDISAAYRKNKYSVMESYKAWLDIFHGQILHVENNRMEVSQAFIDTVAQTVPLREYVEGYGLSGEIFEGRHKRKMSLSEKKSLLRASKWWMSSQYALIGNILLEQTIKESLGAESRERLRGEFSAAKEQALKEQEVRQNLEMVTSLAIQDLGLNWKASSTSVEKIHGELDKKIKALREEAAKLESKPAKGKAASGSDEVDAGLISLLNNIDRLETLKLNIDYSVQQAYNETDPDSLKPAAQKQRLDTMQKSLDGHLAGVSAKKPGLDESLAGQRQSIQSEIEQRYAELLPLLDSLAAQSKVVNDLQNDLQASAKPSAVEGEEPLRDKQALIEELRAATLKLEQIRARKEDLYLRIRDLDDRMKTMAVTYAEQVRDEGDFEAEARRQLEMLKTLPKLERAMNVYCAVYEHAFPVFLYVGNLIAGSGAVLQGKAGPTSMRDTWKDSHSVKQTAVEGAKMVGQTARDVALKLPMVGLGINDFEKCKAYDTGLMDVSFKLGLSLGIKKHLEGAVGLAVEYNARLEVGDYRDFAATSSFAVKATGSLKVPKMFEVTLQVEAFKLSGGFVYQDHYHWAAWVAEGWGRFIARAMACDLYMSNNHVGPDHNPDEAAKRSIDEMARSYFEHNPEIKRVYESIRQYLDCPVLRTKQMEFFKAGEVNFKALDDAWQTGGSIAVSDTELVIAKSDEHGRALECHTEFRTTNLGLSVTFAGYTLTFAGSHVSNDPRLLNNGDIATFTLSPVPGAQVWVKLLDIFLSKALVGKGSLPERAYAFFSTAGKQLISEALKKFGQGYLPGAAKSMEGCFVITQGEPALMYLRTRIAFGGKPWEASIPVYMGISVDVGASFSFKRTFGEAYSWNSLYYAQYLYTGLRQRTKMHLAEGAPAHGLRPTELSGETLWKQYVEAHWDQFWHLFMAIGNEDRLIMKELAACEAKEEAERLKRVCRDQAREGRYSLTPLAPAILSFIPGLFNPIGQAAAVGVKNLVAFKDKAGQALIDNHFNEILPYFQQWMEAEYIKEMRKEEEYSRANFKEAHEGAKEPPLKAGDADLGLNTAVASVLAHKTHKHVRVCENCLKDVKNDYAQAEYQLSSAVVPQKYWVPDDEAKACMEKSCRVPFKSGIFGSNRHHCRICGAVFCDKHCLKKSVPPWVASSKIRICADCERWIAGGLKDVVDSRRAPKALKAAGPHDHEPLKPLVQAHGSVEHHAAAVSHPVESPPVDHAAQVPSSHDMGSSLMGHGKSPSHVSGGGSLMGSGKSPDQNAVVPMRADAIVQQTGTHNCYIDSTLHSVLYRCPGGEAILQRLLKKQADGGWTVNFYHVPAVKVEAGAIVPGHGPEWQQAFEVACKRQLFSRRLIEQMGDIGQLNHLPMLFGWQYMDIPEFEEIAGANSGAIPHERYLSSVREGVVQALSGDLGPGWCVTYMRGMHAVSLMGIAGADDAMNFTFYNPLREEKIQTDPWPEIRTKLLETVQGNPNGGGFCAFRPE